MEDREKTREDLEEEMEEMRRRIADLEQSNAAWDAKYRALYQDGRKEREIYVSLLKSCPDAIVIYDTTGAAQYVSPSFTRMFGWTMEELLGKPVPYLPEAERETTMAMITALFRDGTPCAGFRTRRYTKDGRVLDVSLSASRFNDQWGNSAGSLVLLRDVTDRKRQEEELRTAHDELEERVADRTAELSRMNEKLRTEISERNKIEEALRQSEKQYRRLYEDSMRAQEIYRSLLDSCADGIVTYDLEGKVEYISDSFTRMFGWTLEEVRGKQIPFVPDTEREKTMTRVQRVIQEGAPSSGLETKRYTKDHRVLDVSVSASRFNDHQGNPAGMLAILSDITDRKRVEEQIRRLNEELEQRVLERTAQLAAANKELEAFAYSVSHDLRAPLRSIDGFSQVILEDYGEVLDHQARDYLMRVRSAAARMAQLIDDLLKLSRVARSEMRRQKVDLSAMAHTIASELKRAEPSRQAIFVIAPGLEADGDPRLLRVVMENLIGNAWKFTGKRDVAHIEFGSLQQASPDPGAPRKPVYFVRDNGAGFDMTYADKLFGAFQRLHGACEFPGTGIGLATVQRIVHRHFGSVWAEGAVEQGATFYFTL
jgi:PAS domain S-box-containing protein